MNDEILINSFYSAMDSIYYESKNSLTTYKVNDITYIINIISNLKCKLYKEAYDIYLCNYYFMSTYIPDCYIKYLKDKVELLIFQ